jgi:hypothetical protein
MYGINSVGYGYASPAFGQRIVAENNNQVNYADKEIMTKQPEKQEEKQPEKKKGSLLKDIGVSALALIGLDYLFCKGKHVKSLLKYFGIGKKAAVKPPVKKPAVPTKPVVETPKPPMSNERQAEVIQNLNTQHVSAKNRKLVEQAEKEIVTPEMQAAYDREIAHVEMTPEEKVANEINNIRNKRQRAVLNNVENNSKGGEKLADVKKTMVAAEKAPKTVLADGEYMLDGNRYVIKDGKIQEMTLKGAQKPQTKEVNIAKHETKNNVIARLLEQENATVAAAA